MTHPAGPEKSRKSSHPLELHQRVYVTGLGLGAKRLLGTITQLTMSSGRPSMIVTLDDGNWMLAYPGEVRALNAVERLADLA